MIWFATIRLGEEVHAQALGFTDTFYEFVHADTGDDACLAARLHCERGAASYGKPLKVKRVTVGDVACVKQDIESYCFPEQHVHASKEFSIRDSNQQEENAIREAIRLSQFEKEHQPK